MQNTQEKQEQEQEQEQEQPQPQPQPQPQRQKQKKEKEKEKQKKKMVASKVETEDLPRNHVKRVVKARLADIAQQQQQQQTPSLKDISLQNDALTAFAESARIFIHYLSATANDICKESKRQVINAEDVLKAVEEMEFPELLDSLKTSLDAFRKLNGSKKAEKKSTSTNRKRKSEAELDATNGNDNPKNSNEVQDKLNDEIVEVKDSSDEDA